MNIKDIIDPKLSLQDLSASAPSVWQEVLSDLKQRIENGQSQSLGTLRQEAQRTMNRWQASQDSRLGASQHAYESTLKARMTVMAIDQFADVMTGKVGEKPSWKDRWLIQKWLLQHCEQGQLLSTKEFDRTWSWLRNKSWAAGEIQRAGFWSVPTKEFCTRICDQVKGRPLLELGAGRGLLTKVLHDAGQAIQGIDDLSWSPASRLIRNADSLVTNISAEVALKTKKPAVVLCSWPTPGNSFEASIFTTPSVQLYIAIVSKHRFASGNWQSYQQQSAFTCTTSEPLNQLLRPLEASQQVMLFRRR